MDMEGFYYPRCHDQYRLAKATIRARMCGYGEEMYLKWEGIKRSLMQDEGWPVFDAWEMAGLMIDREVSGDQTLRCAPRHRDVEMFIQAGREKGVKQFLDRRQDAAQLAAKAARDEFGRKMDQAERRAPTGLMRPAGPAGFLIEDKLESRKLWEGKPGCTPSRAVEWARENAFILEACASESPSAEAWGLLVWARSTPKNLDALMGAMISKASPAKEERAVDLRGVVDEDEGLGNTVKHDDSGVAKVIDLAARLRKVRDSGSASDADPGALAG